MLKRGFSLLVLFKFIYKAVFFFFLIIIVFLFIYLCVLNFPVRKSLDTKDRLQYSELIN